MRPPIYRALVLATIALACLAVPATASPWGFDASAFVYVPQNDDVFTAPTLRADRGGLHLEARYNYEDLDTGSLFVGHTFEFEDEDVSGTVVPVIGIVAGNTAGVAPGVNIDLSWGRFAFTTETEVVVELPESSDSFLYSWIEAA